MKICPSCRASFSNDNMFCLNDGSPLVAGVPVDKDNGFSAETPTQVLTPPQAPAAVIAPTQPWVFLIVGVLATALAGALLYIILRSEGGTPRNTTQAPEAKSSNLQVSEFGNYGAANPATAPAIDRLAAPQPSSVPSPAGAWSGDWKSTRTSFTAIAELSESDGLVKGRIVWTLVQSQNPLKSGKSGMSATEYVEGSFDRATRLIKLRGIRKDDPNNLVILDRYNLSLSEDGSILGGRSKNSTYFQLRRL